jgi:tetratricopeptide (TPR) repeat protein
MRVERALRLLPESEAMLPLRALLISMSRPDERQVWSSSGPYLTLGKRGVQPDDVRLRLGKAVQQVTQHVEALYEAYLDALQCDQRRDGAGAVGALLRAGHIEGTVGRYGQARIWYDKALTVAEALPTRRPEVNALRSLGELSLRVGASLEAARHFQRALALTESGFDQIGAVAACEGLGDAAAAQGHWHGGQAWYARGLRLAEASKQAVPSGRLHHRLGRLAALRGDATATREHLRRGREYFEVAGDAKEMAELLNTQGSLDAEAQRPTAAEAAYREALAWARRGDEHDVGLEVSIRINLARLQLGLDRLLEAEEQMRRAEQLAIAGNLVRRLIQIYILMGELRGRQLDPAGFVFFEQAIELCRSLERSPVFESRVCQAYARFKEALGEQEEARAYEERARDILSTAGQADENARVADFLDRAYS